VKALFFGCALTLGLAATAMPADAKGCIKGALIGGIAGHYASHHGVLGAAAGCVVGHHIAKQNMAKQRAMQNSSPEQAR
jgi:outer membrane lipoprotein SlyB